MSEVEQLRRRVLELEHPDTSGLAEFLLSIGYDEEAKVIERAEAILSRALTYSEAYFLGQMVQAFGPDRVLWAVETKRKAKEPIRFAYGMLQNKAAGKEAGKKEVYVERVRYTNLDDYDAF